ncbi:LysM peptidoglycan-binding domain-containing protein [Lactiplantibacillus plantarum]|nr:LysM peptidoglycan-binding domain-containing protein [Lactiplantibacillus plantarum]QAT34698.1 LysM peptidoglycan-binding domain-containing protein [Lactiplantibacillus plantarum]
MAFFMVNVTSQAARMDMVDVSNNNGYMSTAEYVSMRNEFGVKAVTVKISEGGTYKDPYAASNIANVQAAGLYINGYHFARYATKAQAIAEADFAGRTAKAAGLPVGAVLATDVEAEEQNNQSKATNDRNNTAFMKEIQKFGYRTDIYTSGSWANNKMTIKGKTGWIAAYPYSPAGKNWYSTNHAWQWSSTAKFRISYGGFDVSQLNDNYYTADQKSKVKATNKAAVKQQNKTANKGKVINKTKRGPHLKNAVVNQTYAQQGIFYPNTTLNVRSGAGTAYRKVATYYPGESVQYNQVIIKSDYVWARYLRSNGYYGYIALGVNGGANYGKRVVNQVSGHTYYTVKSGDSWWSIAQRNGLSMTTLASQNGKTIYTTIYPGQRLVVR